MVDLRTAVGDLSPARLLVVDDETILRTSTAEILRRKGYSVDEAADGAEALARLESTAYDLMLLDMVLPGTSGVDVMRHARHLAPDLSIIVLTAHAAVDSAIAAVKAGVSDYLLKPCSVEDLTLTINRTLQDRASELRRQQVLNMVTLAMDALHQTGGPAPAAVALATESPAPRAPDSAVRVGMLSLDRERRVATVESDPPLTVELTEGEVSVLVALMEHPNQVMSCNQLASAALGYEGMDRWTVENVIRSCVFRLRQKIQPVPDGPNLICTVRGRGYYFSPS
ncbi:MAG TPA: response regulator transcription factor [Anaerolineae bacterium]